MVELYVTLINDGLKTLNDVPERYREAVAERIEKHGA